MKYLVQAILVDGDRGTVVDSIKTDDYASKLDVVMKRHRHCNHYLYIAMDFDTQEIIVKTTKNKFLM